MGIDEQMKREPCFADSIGAHGASLGGTVATGVHLK